MSEENKKTIKSVTVPLSVEEIKEFFVNKEIIYHVNYKESELKGVVFLTYLSNLDLPAEIDFSGCEYKDKEELIKIYMETRNIIPSDSLRLSVASILLMNRSINPFEYMHNPGFDMEDICQFIPNNQDLINKWEQFIESTTIYAQSTIEALSDILDIENTIKQIDDPSFIGANVVNMFSIPSFYELFLTKPFKHELVYFKPQFQEYMFRGKNFYHYFNCEENNIYKMFTLHLNGDIDAELINKASQEANDMLNVLGEE